MGKPRDFRRNAPMPKGSDTQLQGLIDLANRGDPQAHSLLLDHACERLLALTKRMLGGYPSLKRWEQTDDVFVNGMVRLHRALESVQPESVRHFFNLAGTQIRRELLDLKKHYFGKEGLGANHHTDHQPADEEGGSLQASAQEPEDLTMWSEFHERVEQLPDQLRETFNLLYYDGLTQEESAKVLGVSVSTIKRRWQEARIQLHDGLRESSR
jgi:RNA polymerase sigma factor (sigma-70 family)